MRRKVPNVDFGKQDLQDSSPRVTAETVLRTYMPELKQAQVYTAYVPVEDMPEPQLAEQDEVDEDEDGCGCGYPWEDFSIGRRPFPPVKLHRDRRGRLTILDGNHRSLFWMENDYTHIPAWVIDEAAEPPEWFDADDDE